MADQFMLCGGRIITPEGPYTQTEIRERITILYGREWRWSEEQPDGSFYASAGGEVIAEAVPV